MSGVEWGKTQRLYQRVTYHYQVGFGDNAKYFVDSNEMFVVNDAAVGVARGGVLTTYGTEYTVTAHKKEVGCYIDWLNI